MTKTFQEWFDTLDWSNQKYLAENSRGTIKGYNKDGKETNYYSDIVAYKLKYRIINFIIRQSTKIEYLLGRNQIIRNMRIYLINHP